MHARLPYNSKTHTCIQNIHAEGGRKRKGKKSKGATKGRDIVKRKEVLLSARHDHGARTKRATQRCAATGGINTSSQEPPARVSGTHAHARTCTEVETQEKKVKRKCNANSDQIGAACARGTRGMNQACRCMRMRTRVRAMHFQFTHMHTHRLHRCMSMHMHRHRQARFSTQDVFQRTCACVGRPVPKKLGTCGVDNLSQLPQNLLQRRLRAAFACVRMHMHTMPMRRERGDARGTKS